jgi:hypothetical protein
MEKYILTITENGHERIVCIGTYVNEENKNNFLNEIL